MSLPVLLDDGERKYVWGNGLAYSVSPTGTLLVYHTDGLGSVRALTDGSGYVVQTYGTDEFGIATLTSGTSTQPFQYTGEQRDAETGLVYLRARLYDPAVGRFVSRDPYAGSIAAPLSLSRYAYVENNPVSAVDQNGLASSSVLNDGPSSYTRWAATAVGGGFTGFGGALLFANRYQNRPTRGGQARLGRPDPSMPYGWSRSFHLDRSKSGLYHFNADIGPLARFNHRPVPAWMYPVGSTSALRAIGRVTLLAGLTLDVYSIATAPPEQRGAAVGGVAGAWAGALAGAAVGAVVAEPGVGTVIGAAIGGMLGALGGEMLVIGWSG